VSARPNKSSKSSAKTFRQRSNAFSEYRRRTGSWPALSTALYGGRFVLMLAGITFLFWYGRSHPDTLVRTTTYFLLGTLPVVIAWTVAETAVWNYDLRRKRLIPRGTILGVRQLPPE
jgi:hypothetical protein